ncbi:MAG: AN1-type zinc finger protein, partial [Halorientalis sp.]
CLIESIRNMATCAECGDTVGTTYDCYDCGESFCVDCRLPDDHECTATTDETETDAAAASDGGTAADLQSLSLPSGPRITVLLPVWRAIPWQMQALLAFVSPVLAVVVAFKLRVPLAPYVLGALSPVVLAQHVYHERVADAVTTEAGEAGAWTPSWTYYIPLVVMIAIVPISEPNFFVTMGALAAMVGTLIYVVQKRRHGDSLLSLS